MARIKNVDLPSNKRVEIGLTYIHGIGRKLSRNILTKLNINLDTKVCDLTEEEISKIRKEIPDAVIRTTFMVGYQGETTEDFNELIECIEKCKFERMGAFTFSKEDDTVAETMPGDVLEKVKIILGTR